MSFCAFADGAAIFDATPIENLFLMNYMVDASDLQLKVYLYTRMLAIHPELDGTLSDIAKTFHVSEDQVYDCFTYWENRGLMRRLTDQPPTYALLPLRDERPRGGTALDREMYANRDFNNRLRNLFKGEFIGDTELRKAEEWLNTLKLTQEAVLRLVQYGIDTSATMHYKEPRIPKPKTVFKNIDKLAEEWAAKGVRTLEDVEREIAEASGATELARQVLRKLGMYRNPSEPELEMIQRWTDEWGYSQAEILEACSETVKAHNPTVGYLNSILENRRDGLSGYYRAAAEVLKELNPAMARPAPDQVSQYKALLDKGYAPELIRLAAIQCRRINKDRFDDLEWRLNLWRGEGLKTSEEVEAYTGRMAALSRQLREVFRKAGYEDRRPSPGALKTYGEWKEAFPEALILYAAECSKQAGGSMAYMDKLLTQWRQEGVETVEQARQSHAAFQRSGAAQSGEKPANPALDYAQREYRDEDFGDDFYFDYDRFYGSEDGKK